jgi:hypothetical protein
MVEPTIGELLKLLKDEKTANILLPLNTVLIFSYFFLFVRFGERFLEIDLPTRLILSVALSTTILFYLTLIEALILKRKVEGLVYYFNMVFLFLLAFIVIVYVISKYTVPALIGDIIPTGVMYAIMYVGIVILPLLAPKIFMPSSD